MIMNTNLTPPLVGNDIRLLEYLHRVQPMDLFSVNNSMHRSMVQPNTQPWFQQKLSPHFIHHT